MYKFLIKNGQSLAFLLGAGISILFGILIFVGIKDRSLPEMTNDALMETTIFNFGIQASIALILIAAFLVFVVFAIAGLVRDFKGSLKVLLGIGIILLIFFIFYSISQPEAAGKIKELVDERGMSDSVSKFISAGIKTTGTLLGLTVVIWVFSELRNALK